MLVDSYCGLGGHSFPPKTLLYLHFYAQKFCLSKPMIAGILKYFSELIEMNPEMSAAVAAIKTLLHYLENNRCKYRSAYAGLVSKYCIGQ